MLPEDRIKEGYCFFKGTGKLLKQTEGLSMEKLADSAVEEKARKLSGWEVIAVDGEKRLVRVFTFDDFVGAMAFSVKVGMIAEKADHHPAVLTEWGKVTVSWWGHSLGGLSEKDFEMAEKTSSLYES